MFYNQMASSPLPPPTKQIDLLFTMFLAANILLDETEAKDFGNLVFSKQVLRQIHWLKGNLADCATDIAAYFMHGPYNTFELSIQKAFKKLIETSDELIYLQNEAVLARIDRKKNPKAVKSFKFKLRSFANSTYHLYGQIKIAIDLAPSFQESGSEFLN